MLQPDNDVIRGLGFVALYGAYLEEQLETLRLMFAKVEAIGDREHKWPISRRIEKLKAIAEAFGFETRDCLLLNLDHATVLFQRRNEVIHGRLYAGFGRDQALKSARPNVPDRPIEAAELYELANDFFAMRAAIQRSMLFKIPRALAGAS